MKIGIVTIHAANSYGGVLQAYATQIALSKYGETFIFDYKSVHIDNTLKLLRFGDGPRGFLRGGKDIARIFPRSRLINKFKYFIVNALKCTEKISSLSEFEEISGDFDVIVCGSDQIWNPKVIGSLDPVYFLGVTTGAKKVALSTSFGSYSFGNEEKLKIKKYLDDFGAIFMREKDSARYISNIVNRDVGVTLDPTLMLSGAEWSDIVNSHGYVSKIDGKYILVYALKKDTFTRNAINYVSSQIGIKIVAIDQDPYLGYSADIHISDAGPIDYVGLFRDASFVITNSFHGTAFSINFGVPFISIEPESGRNRMVGLLDSVGLADRFIRNGFDFDGFNVDMSLKNSDNLLLDLRRETANFLDTAFAE